MKDLWRKIWYSEPVVFVGSITAAWTAVAAFDKATDSFSIPLWIYIVATVAVPLLTGLVRGNVTPVNNG